MSQDAPPRAGAQLPATAPFVLTDEAALRRAFDQHYESLLAQASARLGADAAHLAPRVVEQTFVHAWHERTAIATESDLAGYLAEDVQHRSARALSRRTAAHRLAHHGDEGKHNGHGHSGPVTPNRALAWEHVTHVIHGEAHEAEARANAAKVAHHEAASHIKDVGKSRGWLRPVLGGAAVLAAAVAGVWLMDRVSAAAALEAAVTRGTTRTVESRPGQLASVELAEGTKVRLAPESRVFIPEQFGAELRGVRVEGAARFEVAPGVQQPLAIFVRRTVITAQGTTITVRAYADDEGVLVRLDDGSATLKADDETRTLSPGQAIFVPDSAAPREATAGELAEGVSWTQNVVTINNRKISTILPMLQRWYRMNIRVADQRTLDRVISFSAPLDSVSSAISAIERAADVKFGYVGENMVFTPNDKPDPNAKAPAKKK